MMTPFGSELAHERAATVRRQRGRGLSMILVVIGGLAVLGAAAWFWGEDSRGCFDPRDDGGHDPFLPMDRRTSR
ncbi:MAG TPA: hypothetical protein VIX62_09730 [Actinomycetota bacterium]